MARIRTVKPEFWGAPKTARVSRDARLLFLGLLNESDDEGRQLGSAKRIAGVVFPNDSDVSEAMVDAWLAELEMVGLISRYSVNGVTYVLICGFVEHQKMSHPTKSRLPSQSEATPESRLITAGEPPESRRPDLVPGSSDLDLVPRDMEVGATPTGRVFLAWVESTGRDKSRTKLSDDRQKRIGRALKDYPEADLVDAVRGVSRSPFHCGQNDRHRRFDDLHLVLKDAAKIEEFRDLWRNLRPVPVHDRALEAIQQDRMQRGELG